MSRTVPITSSPRTGRYQHVVFADAINGSARAVNFAPDSDQAELGAEQPLVGEENIFVHWLFRQNGLDVRNYRAESLARRLPACLRTLRVSNVLHARAAILQMPSLMQPAISALLIGVTDFFRDAPVFESLENFVIPELKDRLGRGEPVYIWSAACSDGAELYSIAMLLAEAGALEDESALARLHLLGTDCRESAVVSAAAGVFDSRSIRGVSDVRLSRFFESCEENRWRVLPFIRRLIRWRSGDLLGAVEPGAWNLILCRNAAMYMRCSVAGLLWNRLQTALNPGGYLVLGKAERPSGANRLSSCRPCIFRRV